MHRLKVLTAAFASLAAAVWMGGIFVLGAVVAPTVFRVVHAPESADAMTLVFRRFDRIAMAAAVVVCLCEAARSRVSSPTRLDFARFGVAVLASGLAFVQGLWLSPSIAYLHAHGAVRGLGELGAALERTHRWSEANGKAEFAALAAFVVLQVASSLAGAPRASAEESRR